MLWLKLLSVENPSQRGSGYGLAASLLRSVRTSKGRKLWLVICQLLGRVIHDS
jgi:hypothetical protein